MRLTVEKEEEKQRQLLEDYTLAFEEDFSADVRVLFGLGLIYFREDDADEPSMGLTPLGILVAAEIKREEEN